jgi:hypothetical protein
MANPLTDSYLKESTKLDGENYVHWKFKIMMQEHRQQVEVEDNWIYTSAHFEDILNFKGWHINVIAGRM